MKDNGYNPHREFNEWLNSFMFSELTYASMKTFAGDEWGYYLASYLRDLIAGTIVYWSTAGLWHLYIYAAHGEKYFEDEKRPYPTTEIIRDQQKLAQASLFLYAALPICSEYLIENGYTRSYFYIAELGGSFGGWYYYFINTVFYVALVEIGIYWMHRTLHTNKFLYKWLHSTHHKYMEHSTLTPWASIAFNPFDGLAQASPYVVVMFIVPIHYYTHMIMLFFSGIWATNIHDSVWVDDAEPIMGSKYHTIHHTHFMYNFGQWFTFCDHFWGTLRLPPKEEWMEASRSQRQVGGSASGVKGKGDKGAALKTQPGSGANAEEDEQEATIRVVPPRKRSASRARRTKRD
jgi:Delta7-sterol 5-desaturase